MYLEGKGLYITGGKVTNQGNIIINSGTGLQIKNGKKGEVINSGNILIKGGTGYISCRRKFY